jgi:SAM-dependent methyltransferase
VLLIRGQSTGADLAGLPLPDGCMDLIVSTASLHHWTDASAVIVSPDRALRPNGRIWVFEYVARDRRRHRRPACWPDGFERLDSAIQRNFSGIRVQVPLGHENWCDFPKSDTT